MTMSKLTKEEAAKLTTLSTRYSHAVQTFVNASRDNDRIRIAVAVEEMHLCDEKFTDYLDSLTVKPVISICCMLCGRVYPKSPNGFTPHACTGPLYLRPNGTIPSHIPNPELIK